MGFRGLGFRVEGFRGFRGLGGLEFRGVGLRGLGFTVKVEDKGHSLAPVTVAAVLFKLLLLSCRLRSTFKCC